MTLLGDKGYVGKDLASELESERHIALISMKRSSCKNKMPKDFRQMFFKA